MLNPAYTRSKKIRHIVDSLYSQDKSWFVLQKLRFKMIVIPTVFGKHPFPSFLINCFFFIATVPWKSPSFVVKLYSYTNIAAHHVNTFYIFSLKHDDVAILRLTAFLNSIYFTRLSLLFQTAEGTPAQQTVKPPHQGRGDGNQSFTKPAKQRPGLKFNETMH